MKGLIALREEAEAAYGRCERNETPARKSTRRGGWLATETSGEEPTQDDMDTIELDTRTDEHGDVNPSHRRV